jgi:HSP20 family protein
MFSDFHRRMSQLFAEIEGVYDGVAPPISQPSGPPINLHDAGETLVMRVQVPGMVAEDIHIHGNQEMVTIRGERRDERPANFNSHRRERGSIQFSRSFTLPCRVDLERTNAMVKDGLLTVRLTKDTEAMPRQIMVKR